MKKIILIAFSLHPKYGSEAGHASKWLSIMSERYFTEVFTDVDGQDAISREHFKNTKFNYIEGINSWKKFGRKTGLRNVATRVFFNKVETELKKLNLSDFDLIHCITPAGVHSHNALYKLGLPVIIGPLGGGLPTPSGFNEAFRRERYKTYARDLFYWYQFRWGFGLKQYLLNANKIVLGLSTPQNMLPENAREKCVFIPDALVDTSFFNPAIDKQKNGVVKILFAGRLVSNKGPFLLLDAIQQVLQRGVNNFLVDFAGSGVLQSQIEQQIKTNNLSKHINAPQRLNKDELLHKYRSSDIFCLPTLREPGGIAILEAMACGLPVITSNYGGPAKSVTETCGIKINLKNYSTYVDDLANALIYLIENPSVRHRLGAAGRIHVENEYSMTALSEKIFTLYESEPLPQVTKDRGHKL